MLMNQMNIKQKRTQSCQNRLSSYAISEDLVFYIKEYHKPMEKQAQVTEVMDKNLVFKEYSSLEPSTRSKFINNIKKMKYDKDNILWVASQKIHGANFSIHYNGEFVRYGRRNDFLTKDIPVPCQNPGEYFNQHFFDAKNQVIKFHNKLQAVYENIKQFDPFLLKFVIYGEYFGGNWPEDHPQYVKEGPKHVQNGIYYTPNHQFFAFDIFITSSIQAYWVDVTDIPKLLKDKISSVPIYARGTFDQIFDINIKINSTIPELLGLQRLGNNLIEGMVIRPNKDLKTTSGHRVIIKKKNKEFLQKVSQPNPIKKEKKQKALHPQISQFVDELAQYVNVNRINSVVSKYPDLQDPNQLKELVKVDILIDAEKDQTKLPTDKTKYKEVIKELNNIISKEIDNYFQKK